MSVPPGHESAHAHTHADTSPEDQSGVIARIESGDRRHGNRSPFVSRVVVTVLGPGGCPVESWECTSHNLSRDGLAFSVRRRIELGSRVIVEGPSSIPGRNVSYYGVVHQVRQAGPDNFVVGISFEPMPVDATLHDWLARRPTLQEE